MTEGIVVLITAGSTEEAEKIGRCSGRGAPCGVRQPDTPGPLPLLLGRQDPGRPGDPADMQEQEIRSGKAHPRVKELHSYTVPEIIALPIVGGSADYLSWIEAEYDPIE